MKKLLLKFLMLVLTVTAVVACFTVTASAATYGGVAKNTQWTVDTDTGVLTITCDGEMGTWTEGATPWYKYRSYITEIVFSESYATSSITDYAFSGMPSLEKIDIPNSIENIGDYAFKNCSAVKSISIPLSVRKWGLTPFTGCTNVEYIYTNNESDLSAEVPVWDSTVGSAKGNVKLEVSCRSVGKYAFYQLATVSELILPDTMSSINDYAFYGFTAPMSLELPYATTIGNYSFYGCTGLTKLILPVTTTIGNCAFSGCSALEGFSIPVVRTIGENAFENCSKISALDVPAATSIGASAFKGCTGLQKAVLDSAKTIGAYAFSNCTKLVDAYFPSVTSIGAGAFQNDSLLPALSAPLCETVGASAFQNCTNIESVYLPSATTLEANALNGCNAKKIVVGNKDSNLTFGQYAIANCVYCEELYVGKLPTGNVVAFDKIGDSTANGTKITFGAKVSEISKDIFGAEIIGTVSRYFLVAESGSVISSIPASAFESDERLVGVDLSGISGDLTLGEKAFYNCANIKYFSTNCGTLTLNALSFGNLVNASEFVLNAKSQSSNVNISATSIGGTVTASNISIPATKLHSNYNIYNINGNGTGELTPTITTSNTSNHPMYGLGKNVGTKLVVGEGVQSIATSLFTTGYQMVINGGNTILNIPIKTTAHNNNNASSYVESAQYNLALTCNPSQFLSTEINISSIDANSLNLVSVGNTSFGSTIACCVWENAIGGTETSYPGLFFSSTKSSTAFRSESSKYGYSTNDGNSWFWSTFSVGSNPDCVYGANNSAQIPLYKMDAAGNVNGKPVYVGKVGETAFDTGNCYSYYYNSFGYPINKNANSNMNTTNAYYGTTWYAGFTSESIINKYFTTYCSGTAINATEATNIDETVQSKLTEKDSLTNVNLGTTGVNCVIKQGAFQLCSGIKTAFLSSGITSVEGNAFRTQKTTTKVGTMTVYSSGIANDTGISTNNNMNVVYKADYADFGEVVNSWASGEDTIYLYKQTSGDYLVYIVGTGATADYTANSVPWIADASKVKTVVIGTNVTALGNYIFANHPNLSTIIWTGTQTIKNIPCGTKLTTIGEHAFDGCSSLAGLTVWPATLTTIKSEAFANCTAVKRITIPTSIVELGSGVFKNCSNVESVYYCANLTAPITENSSPFLNMPFLTEFTISDDVTALPSFLFYNTAFRYLEVGKNVTNIGCATFGNTPNLTLTVSDANTSFAMFQDGTLRTADGKTLVNYPSNATAKSYVFPISIEHIGAGAFYGNDVLTSVSFDAAILSIGDYAFYNCKYTEDSVAETLQISITDFADAASFAAEVTLGTDWSGKAVVTFSNMMWDVGAIPNTVFAQMFSDGSLNITGEGKMKDWATSNTVEWAVKAPIISSVNIADGITSIGSYAFYGCSTMTDISIPKSVSSIGQYAFYNCSYLTAIQVPDAVQEIKTYTFAGCRNLKNIQLGLNVQKISPYAFADCTELINLALPGSTNLVSANAFSGDGKCVLMVLGKSQKADFVLADGLANVARIIYIPEIETGRLMATGETVAVAGIKRVGENSDVMADTYRYNVSNSLCGYIFDSDEDKKADLLYLAGAYSMTEYDMEANKAPWLVWNQSLRQIIVDDDVTTIGANAFNGCKALEYARIGKGVTSIGQRAFYNCPAITMMDYRAQNVTSAINSASEVFVNSGSPDGFTVVIEDTATVIPAYLMNGCENLSSLTIGPNVITVNSNSFSNCGKLTDVYLRGSIATASDDIFCNSGKASGGFNVIVSAEVTKIPSRIFKSTNAGYPYITSIAVESGSLLESIEDSSFAGSKRLTSADFSNCTKLLKVGNMAFQNCSRLTNANFANCTKLQNIETHAFDGCTQLADFSIANCVNLKYIKDYAFQNCSNVATFVIPQSVSGVDSNTFYGWTASQSIYALGKTSDSDFTTTSGSSSPGASWHGLAIVYYSKAQWDVSAESNPNSVYAYFMEPNGASTDTIRALYVAGSGATKDFDNADHWKVDGGTDKRSFFHKIVVQDGVTSIGANMFSGCVAAKALEIGSDLQSVGSHAFYGCTLIPQADFSASTKLQSIGSSALAGCKAMTMVNLSGCNDLNAVGSNAFDKLSSDSLLYVSTELLYNMLANVNGNIKSTYGTTENTKVITVTIVFSQDIASVGVSAGVPVSFSVVAKCANDLTFHWYYATEKNGQWTEITPATIGYTISSTTTGSILSLDKSIVTTEKNGYYYFCEAESAYYTAQSSKALLAVYDRAITPIITVTNRDGDALESNTWTKGPLLISVTPGTATNNVATSYQYRLKASGTWRNIGTYEVVDELGNSSTLLNTMSYDTEGIVTLYIRAIINDDAGAASDYVSYILKVDNSAPTIEISADPTTGTTEAVELTATATDDVSGIESFAWYKAAQFDDSLGTFYGYIPLSTTSDISVLTMDVAKVTYEGSGDELVVNVKNNLSNVTVNSSDDAYKNVTAMLNSTGDKNTGNKFSEFMMFKISVTDKESADALLGTDDNGIITMPIPSSYFDGNGKLKNIGLYYFARTGIATEIDSYTYNADDSTLTFEANTFGYIALAIKN